MSQDTLPAIFRETQDNEAVRVLIITGTGKGFCSGADVFKNLDAVRTGEVKLKRKTIEEPVGGWLRHLAAIRKPVISAINGIAAGVGFSITLLSDFRIASEHAKFGAVFVRRGLMPDGGCTVMLPMIVGVPKALELCLNGDVIGAEEALAINLVNKVVPGTKLMEEAQALAQRMAEGPPLALSFIKRAIYQNAKAGFEEGLYFESWGQNVLMGTKDFQEGLQSFIEKRKPVFTGE